MFQRFSSDSVLDVQRTLYTDNSQEACANNQQIIRARNGKAIKLLPAYMSRFFFFSIMPVTSDNHESVKLNVK